MPPVVAAAGIAAGAQIAGGVIGARANSGAMKAQEKARQEALAYERQKQAESKALQQQQADAYRKAWLAWAARVGQAGIDRYGVPVGIDWPGGGLSGKVAGAQPSTSKPGSPEPAPNPSTSVPPAAAPSVQAPAGGPEGSLGGLGGAPAAATPLVPPATSGPQPMAAQGGTLGDLGGWNDWRRYGVGA